MRRITNTQIRVQRENQRKYMEKLTTQSKSKTVEFNEKSASLRYKKPFRPKDLQLDSSENTMDEIKPPRIRRVGSSPRTGLMPASTYKSKSSSSMPPQTSNNVDSDTGSEVLSSTPTNPGFVAAASYQQQQLRIPSVSLNGYSNLLHHAYSTPVKKSFSAIGNDVIDENAIEDALDYSPIELNKKTSTTSSTTTTRNNSSKERQKSEQLISKRSSLLPPPTATNIRRHASLAVDNPSQQLKPPSIRGSVLKRGSVAMEQIKKVDLDEVYSVYKQLGTGRFGFVKLAEHKQSKTNIAIKFFPRPQIKQSDFIREYNYSFFLSPHPNIIDTYDGMFQTNDDSAFFFVQEFCPHASLREAVENSQGGIGEIATKEILGKVLSAVEFMHNENLVHRNLKAENILIFDKNNYTRVKITDFGLTRKIDSTVKYLEYVSSYHAPELCETVVNEVLTVKCSIDVWALAIIFYYCLKGRFPWQKASIMCKPYWEWEQWLKRKSPSLPKRWDVFSDKSLKIFKKCLTPKTKDRLTVKDMRKIITKEKLLKSPKSDSADEYEYYPEETSKSEKKIVDESKTPKKRSVIQEWINTTLSTMAEISEQVVSARDE